MEATRVQRRVRLGQAVLGLGALGGYMMVHLWEVSAVSVGRVAFAERLWRPLWAEVVLIGLPLLAHVVLSVYSTWKLPGATGYSSHNSRRLEQLTGVALGVFLAVHFLHVGLYRVSYAGSAEAVHRALMSDMGRPAYLAFYAIGTGTACVHLMLGAAAILVGWDLVRRPRTIRQLRYAFGASAFALWVFWLDTISYFATGTELF